MLIDETQQGLEIPSDPDCTTTRWFVPACMDTRDYLPKDAGHMENTPCDMIVYLYKGKTGGRGVSYTYLHHAEFSLSAETLLWLAKISRGEALRNPNNKAVITSQAALQKARKTQ
jgi:hypothetical protein